MAKKALKAGSPTVLKRASCIFRSEAPRSLSAQKPLHALGKSPAHCLLAAGVKSNEILNLLDVLADVVRPVEIAFLWRPQLRDPNDDLVLEVAVNGQGLGQEVGILTFNHRDFLPQALKFGVAVLTPQQIFKGA